MTTYSIDSIDKSMRMTTFSKQQYHPLRRALLRDYLPYQQLLLLISFVIGKHDYTGIILLLYSIQTGTGDDFTRRSRNDPL